MTSPSSFNVSGLLSGVAGQIDTTTLISQLMTAQAIPQTQLKDQLSTLTNVLTAYQSINTKLTALQTAAQAVTDPTAWAATTTASSSTSVAATSDASASVGSTTFDVTRLARAQVSTVAASGQTVVSDPSNGITFTMPDGTSNTVDLDAGDATSVAKAINSAAIGVRASVVSTENGTILQLSSTKTGTAAGFTVSGFDSPANTVVSGQDAQISVGDSSSGGYTVTSATNTFTGFIPGVTFSVSALATDVTLSVASDSSSISDKVQALVTAANTANTELGNDSAQGAVLQGKYDVRAVSAAIGSTVSSGTLTGQSLKPYGIDIDKNGVLSFDATAFAAAYAADPTGTQTALASAFASRLNTAATAATDPTTGSITASISTTTDQGTRLQSEIDDWTTRLANIQTSLQAKYSAMQTALSKLQSQQTYLTSMFSSLNSSSSSSSSSSS